VTIGHNTESDKQLKVFFTRDKRAKGENKTGEVDREGVGKPSKKRIDTPQQRRRKKIGGLINKIGKEEGCVTPLCICRGVRFEGRKSIGKNCYLDDVCTRHGGSKGSGGGLGDGVESPLMGG